MTPNEQRMLTLFETTVAGVVEGFDREDIPNNTAFAIAFQVALVLLDRMEPELRRTIAASLITRLSAAQRLDA